MRTPLVKNSLSPSPLWRRLLFTVSAVAFVAPGVALQPTAHAGTAATPTPTPPQFQLLATVVLGPNALGDVAVNKALNKIYTSGGASSAQDVEVIDGVTFAPPVDVGTGAGASVDNRTDRYWAATVYDGTVIIRDGTTDATIATVPIPQPACPIGTNYDFFNRRVWVGSQCGNLHDPIYAIDAKSFAIISPRIDSGGVLSSSLIANGANGRFYFAAQPNGVGNYISKRVDPTTFAVTLNAFGRVLAINALTNTLYAVPDTSNDLQIIDGKPDPEVILKTVSLSYHPSSLGINTALNHLYLANSVAQSIEVRDGSKGKLITTFSLSSLGLTPDGPMAVDSIRGRIYIISYTPSSQLLVIEDLITASGPDCILSH